MVEAVTSRVSVLPVVGSDLLTGLSVAAGGTYQLFVGSGGILDKVGHGAGRSGVRIAPVERLLKLREVRDIMFYWMRPMAVLTSQFFLSDEGDDVEMPLHINDDRASLQQSSLQLTQVSLLEILPTNLVFEKSAVVWKMGFGTKRPNLTKLLYTV